MSIGVYQIRNVINGKLYIGSAAKQYGFKACTISNIKAGRKWGYVSV